MAITEARRLTPRGRERRKQLMEYAATRFAEHGYHPTSVSDIVGGISVGKGVFYWYFESKEQLFTELLRDAQTDLRRTQRDAIADEPDPLRRLELGVRAAFRWWAEHPEIVNLTQFAATESRFAAAIKRGQEVAIADAVVHIKDGIAEGRIRDMDPELLAHATLGLVGSLAREYLRRRTGEVDEFADVAVEVMLLGLAVAPNEPR